MEIVLDTNVLVSLALSRSATMQRLAWAWRESGFEILTYRELLEEFADVTERPHLAPLFSGEGLEFVKDLLEAVAAVLPRVLSSQD